MSFFKKLFSSDYRAAVAAEAAGEFDLAAEHYALAGHHDAVVRMHLARAERAANRAAEITALRDALHWAGDDRALRAVAARGLGEALLAKSRAEAVATERDRQRVREAATLLVEAGDYGEAGKAFEMIGEDRLAADAYRQGGLVDRMEEALSREQERTERDRVRRDAFADYELNLHGGDRDAAVEALRRSLKATDDRSELRRLLDELESRLITGHHVTLKPRHGAAVTLSSAREILIGRDPLCDMPLRSGGVSRKHCSIQLGDDGSFHLADAGSRNGTLVGGLPISGSIPLVDRGEFALGDQCRIEYSVASGPPLLTLRIVGGLDSGARLIAGLEGQVLPAPFGTETGESAPLRLRFARGRPYARATGGAFALNGENLAQVEVQLIHGDVLTVGDSEIEVM